MNGNYRERVRRGEDHPRAKLTEMDVLLLREANRLREYHRREARKLSVKSLAKKFDMSYHGTWAAINYETWKHVQDV